ncbi:MAG: DUF2079 domain-containing protein [Herpetosiphonaceae bacterium]|nr:DUF2079 domain-containing protein [Herpetosiphonaceae bacterium]
MQRRSLAVLLLLSVWGVLLTALSVARYSAYNSGMLDLGNMVQAIADAARGGALHYSAPNGMVSRLAGHAEVIYFALALLYRMWPDPRGLLVIQALLAASGAWPAAQLARQLGMSHRAALLCAASYLLMPTAVAAILFDLHGDTLAMPLLMWLLLAVAKGRWRWSFVWAGLSLLCKWYIAGPIALLGLTLLSRRTAPFALADVPHRRRTGLGLVALATAWTCFVFFGLHNWFRSASSGDAAYLSYYFHDILHVDMSGVLDRSINVVVVVLPTALLWCWSPWTAVPALAIIGPAMITTGPGAAYAWSYHHYAAAVPFLIAGTIDGARRRAAAVPARRRGQYMAWQASLLFCTTLVFHVGLSDTPLAIPFWRGGPGSGLDPSGYRRTSRDGLKDRWLAATVAPGRSIATSNFLAPHVADRSTLLLVRYPDEAGAAQLAQHLDMIEAAYPDALFDFLTTSGSGYAGGVSYDHAAIRELLQAPQWGLIDARDGLLAFARNSPLQQLLPQTLRTVVDTAPEQARFADQIGLVQANITGAGAGRWHAIFRWRMLGTAPSGLSFPVSRLDGVGNARIVHLPMMILRSAHWQTNQVLEEQFDLRLPPDLPPGRYTWRVGWYDGTSPFAAATDTRSRIGNEVRITQINVP